MSAEQDADRDVKTLADWHSGETMGDVLQRVTTVRRGVGDVDMKSGTSTLVETASKQAPDSDTSKKKKKNKAHD